MILLRVSSGVWAYASNDARAAFTAVSRSGWTPSGVVAPGFAVCAPFSSRSSTSATMDSMRLSSIAMGTPLNDSALEHRARALHVHVATADLHRIHDPADHGVHRLLARHFRHARRRALRHQHQLAGACAHSVGR